jgi:hypothetical protein
MNVEIGTEAAQIIFWDYINPNFFAVQELRLRSQGDKTQRHRMSLHGPRAGLAQMAWAFKPKG